MSIFFLKWFIAAIILFALILVCYLYVVTQKEIKKKNDYLEKLNNNINSQVDQNYILNQKVKLSDHSNANLHFQILTICKELLQLQEVVIKFKK